MTINFLSSSGSKSLNYTNFKYEIVYVEKEISVLYLFEFLNDITNYAFGSI